MDHTPRLFPDDAAVRHIGEGLIACTLARAEWTHEAHLAACLYVVAERADLVAERDLPNLIRRFNESVGGVNDDTQGYHETITQVSIRGVRAVLAATDAGLPLVSKVNALLLAEEGRRDWPLRFYSAEVLFSKEARLGWVEADLAGCRGFSFGAVLPVTPPLPGPLPRGERGAWAGGELELQAAVRL
jgi:hypothetical protein